MDEISRFARLLAYQRARQYTPRESKGSDR